MRTIAIAASIALITGGGVAGIMVGGTGAKMAREHTPLGSTQPAAGTTAMNRTSQSDASGIVSEAPAELRLGHDAAPATSPIAMDMDAVFPEQHGAPARATPARMPRTTVVQPARTSQPAAQIVLPEPIDLGHLARSAMITASVPSLAPEPPPTLVVTHAPPSLTPSVSSAAVTQAQPQTPVTTTPRAGINRRTPVRSARVAPRTPQRTPARAAVAPAQTAPAPQIATVPSPPAAQGTAPGTTVPIDATRRTTMSGGEPVATEPPPATTAASSSTPPASAQSPPSEQPSTLLANP